MKTNAIGLPVEGTQVLAKELDRLLADYTVFYQNVRGYHWNIRGRQFFELHAIFEQLYNDLALKIDEVAERMLTLGAKPDHRYTNYAKIARVKESAIVDDGEAAVKDIINTLTTLLQNQRFILSEAQELGDEGTAALMGDYIRENEKLVWMYSAYIAE